MGYIPKNGEYYYTPHRRMWAVYKKIIRESGISMDNFICEFPTKEEAAEKVKELNNW